MGGKSKGPNEKKIAGNAQKEEVAARKRAEEARKKEAEEAADWAKGSNITKAARVEAANLKADEAARKRREKAELLAAEEAELGKGGKVKGVTGPKRKGKKKDDLSLLEDALVSSADKKMKKKKEEMLAKQRKEEASQKSREGEIQEDPLLANTKQMIGESAGRDANVAKASIEASGIDVALVSLNVSDDPKAAKSLFKAFEARMLPIVKEENPGLRMTQQKEKVFQMWKRSPENPQNQAS